MPVGNSEKGVGLWAGQVMFSSDQMIDYMDWFHGPLKGEGDSLNHKGNMFSFLINPKVTIGLTNYWNLTVGLTLGHRRMGWKGGFNSIHHRSESTNTNFVNSNGGYLGDSKVIANYLVFNDGQGTGKRFYLGAGLIIPSKNTLTSDPFFLNNEDKKEHRHFSLSEGVYKSVFETQYFIKRNTNPVFIGGVFSVTNPIKENKYGFKSSAVYDLALTGFTKEISWLKGSLGVSTSLQRNTQAFWNGKPAPNSNSTILVLGVGSTWSIKHSGINFNLRLPLFLKGGLNEEVDGLEQEVKGLQASVGYRKVLDWTIPWIDPLKGL